MAFTPNEYCVVTLTEAGANALNTKGKALNETFPRGCWRTDWKENEDYRAQFWAMCAAFEGSWRAGAPMAFSDMRLEPIDATQ